MKLINKLITKTAIYKHLKDLYEQALRDNEFLTEKYNKLVERNNKLVDEYNNAIDKQNSLCIEFNEEITKMRKNVLEMFNNQVGIEQLKKIRTHVNKLDKKDENVKEIKRLIKEVL